MRKLLSVGMLLALSVTGAFAQTRTTLKGDYIESRSANIYN